MKALIAGEVGVMAEKRQRYDSEFREGAVRIVTETGKPVAEVAEDLGVKETTLGSWVARARRAGTAGSAVESEDLSQPFAERLRAFTTSPQAAADLRCYFGIGLLPGAVPFTGRWFEHLADMVTAADLIAVETLSATIPVERRLDLLEGPLGAHLSGLLATIPTKVDLADADAAVVADSSPADQAWRLLESQYGLGRVIAGKILARKRPRLLPVYDRVVRCAVGRPSSFWLALHTFLAPSGSRQAGPRHPTNRG